MKRPYAEGTSVPAEQSKAQIERMLERYGATSFASGWRESQAVVQFEAKGRRIRFRMTIPAGEDDASAKERRRRWRCLVLVIKSKLESVETGIESFEEAFLPHIVVPGRDGMTIGEWIAPELQQAYERGAHMPPLLGPGT